MTSPASRGIAAMQHPDPQWPNLTSDDRELQAHAASEGSLSASENQRRAWQKDTGSR